MSAWITGNAMGDSPPDPDDLQVHLTRDAAIEVLKDEMLRLAEDQDQASTNVFLLHDDADLASASVCQASWGAVWADDGPAAPQITAGGDVHLTLTDGPLTWRFWAVESPVDYYVLGEDDEEPLTAEEALQRWTDAFVPARKGELELMTGAIGIVLDNIGDIDDEAAVKIRVMKDFAHYHRIDLEGRGCPLPTKV